MHRLRNTVFVIGAVLSEKLGPSAIVALIDGACVDHPLVCDKLD